MNRLAMILLKNIFILPGAYSKLKYNAKHTDEIPEIEKYQHIQYMLKRAVNAGNIDLVVTGTENLSEENGFMLYANHQGLFDVVAVAATCDKPLGAVLKKELMDVAFLRYIAECTYSFPMDREDVRQSLTVIQNVIQELKKGRNYLIFPEGTRSKKGNEMLEFHNGSFRCATKSKCPIVPIALVDSFKVLDQKGSRPVKVQIHYLEPIYYEEYQNLKTTELAELVKSRIAAKIEACLREQET